MTVSRHQHLHELSRGHERVYLRVPHGAAFSRGDSGRAGAGGIRNPSWIHAGLRRSCLEELSG